MFNNVIVGIDGREGGRDAMALAKLLRGEGGELTLGYVYPSSPVGGWGSDSGYARAESERARDLLDQARGQLGVEAKLRWHGAPSVGRGLHELAEAVGADLLVIGSTRRGVLGRVLTGDDTRAALGGAPCAVAVAPVAYSRHTAGTGEIGVGYDGSPEAEHALAVARKLAKAHGARLSAFEAVAFPTYLCMGPAATDETTNEALVEAARDRVARLEGVEPHAAYGQAAEELTLYSASLDLLVIGSRSYGPIGRLMHGSTAQQLARSARCPMLVLTRAARASETRAASRDVNGATAATAAH